jgi:hypothetical protein
MSALTLFGKIPETKEAIYFYIKTAKDEILKGEYNPLEIETKLKRMELIIEGLRKDFDLKEAVQIEADLYPEKTIKKYGCEITKKMNSSYNFDLCGDSELVRLQDLAKETSEKLKQRQDFLKMIRGELTIVNSVTGEITTIYEPDVKKSDVISIKVL